MVEISFLKPKIHHGWFCQECNAIYLNDGDDGEHENLHISIFFINYDTLKEWIKDAEEFGLHPIEIITAILNNFQVE